MSNRKSGFLIFSFWSISSLIIQLYNYAINDYNEAANNLPFESRCFRDPVLNVNRN